MLLTLMREPVDGLSGIVEADEMYILESVKGKNQVEKLGLRMPLKRGGASQYRGISREQVCVNRMESLRWSATAALTALR